MGGRLPCLYRVPNDRKDSMASSNKRQQTMAKRARELAVKEKRAEKQEKKAARAAAAAAGESPAVEPVEDETTTG
jgi:hypothetical protein